MKKILLILIFTGILVGKNQAQVFTLGPKFGVSQGNVQVFDGFQGEDAQMGYHLGAFARINLPVIYLQPEVLYTNTGGSFSGDTFNYEVNFDRLDVPVMVGIRFAGIFRLQAGPIASYMINSNLTSDNANQRTIIPPKEDFTFGYQAGLGLDIGNFLMDLKYEGAMTNSVNRFNSVPTDQRQNQLILSLGFRLF